MLENSAVARFRDENCMRKLNTANEIKKIEAKQLLGDFSGASVYVLGAGILKGTCKPTLSGTKKVLQLFWQYPLADANAARPPSPDALQTLKSFWQSYFQRSNAKLVEFGMPMLLGKLP